LLSVTFYKEWKPIGLTNRYLFDPRQVNFWTIQSVMKKTF